MRTSVLRARDLTPEQLESWSIILRNSPELGSPYFRPEFTRGVAAVRDDVEVAVLEQDGEAVGFFPYQRRRRNIAKPVGGRLSDFQAVVAAPGVSWNLLELLKDCRLKAWDYDHLLLSQAAAHCHHRLVEDSPFVDLSGGFEAYALRHSGRMQNAFPHLAYKVRRLERLAGPVRFVPETRDRQVFETLLTWKAEQYVRTGATNVFAYDWTRQLLEHIWNCRDESFSGVLSALYVGDRLAAAHFGMRSYGVLHHWFPAYDTAFAPFSPGMIRDLLMLEHSAAQGIQRVDFGKGMNDLKAYFMTGSVRVAVGSTDLRPLSRFAQQQWHRAHSWARSTWIRRPARVPARVLYRFREWLAFQ